MKHLHSNHGFAKYLIYLLNPVGILSLHDMKNDFFMKLWTQLKVTNLIIVLNNNIFKYHPFANHLSNISITQALQDPSLIETCVTNLQKYELKVLMFAAPFSIPDSGKY